MFFLNSTDQIFNAFIDVINIIAFSYCIYFINKIRKSGTNSQKEVVKASAMDTLVLTLFVFIFVNVLALIMYILGELGVGEQIRISASALPLKVSGIIVIIFYGSYKSQLLKSQKKD